MVTDPTDSTSWPSTPSGPTGRTPLANAIESGARQVAIDARIGRLVGQRYRITRLLGVGGMAAVYEAEQRDGERVALKMLHGTHAQRMDRRKRFLREAYLANAIGHSGVARVLADGVDDDGTVFLVMERLQGQTARALQRRAGGRLDVHTALWIADEVASRAFATRALTPPRRSRAAALPVRAAAHRAPVDRDPEPPIRNTDGVVRDVVDPWQ